MYDKMELKVMQETGTPIAGMNKLYFREANSGKSVKVTLPAYSFTPGEQINFNATARLIGTVEPVYYNISATLFTLHDSFDVSILEGNVHLPSNLTLNLTSRVRDNDIPAQN